ncbi:hypothetical protein BDQ12DRAFT_53508 [Crucibulum laeve]|uniref:Uncharacterized protein n=1 Tax=Crucibulum laeve TaxID=68775 RepID=A0A5C3M2J5_9AGAR|nr:hypothetical protein BDQ12DRAFT_53508 [Crucibulum laeve]
MSSLAMSVYSTGPLACDEDFLANDLVEGGEQPIETPATALSQSFVAKQKHDSISPQAPASWDDMTLNVGESHFHLANVSACRSTIIAPAATPPIVHSSSSASPLVSIPHQVDPVAAIVAQAQRREAVKRENAKVRQARMKAATHFPQDTPTSYNQYRHLDPTEIPAVPFHYQYAGSCQPLYPCRHQQLQSPAQSQHQHPFKAQQPQLPTQYETPKCPAQLQQSIERSEDFMPQTVYISSAPRQPFPPHAVSKPSRSAPNASQDPNDVILDLFAQTAKQKTLRLEAERVEKERIGAGYRGQPVPSEVQMKQVPVVTYVPLGWGTMEWGGTVKADHEPQHEPVIAEYKPIRPLSPEREPAPDSEEKSIENEEEEEEGKEGPVRRPIAPLPKRRIRPTVGVVGPVQPLEPEPAPKPDEEEEEVDPEPEEETESAMKPITPLPKRRVRPASGVIVPTVPIPAPVAPVLTTTVEASSSQQQETLQGSSSVDTRRVSELLELSSPLLSLPSPSSSSLSTVMSTPPTSVPPSPLCSRPCTPPQVLRSVENTLWCAHPSVPTSLTPPCALTSSAPPCAPTSSSPPGSNSTSTGRKPSLDEVTPREWKARSVSVYEEIVSRPSPDEVAFRASSSRGSSSSSAAGRGSSSSRDSPPSSSLVRGTTTKLLLDLAASRSSAAKNRMRQMMGFQDQLVGLKGKEKEKKAEKEPRSQSTPLSSQSTQEKKRGKGKADKDNTKEKATPKGGRWRSTFVPVPSASHEEEDYLPPSTPLHRVAPRIIRPSSTVKSGEGSGSIASDVLATPPSAMMGNSTTPKATPPVRKVLVTTSSTKAVSSSVFQGGSTTPKALAPTSSILAAGRSEPTTLAGTSAIPSVFGTALVTSKAPVPASSIQAGSLSMFAGLAATYSAATSSLFETTSTTSKHLFRTRVWQRSRWQPHRRCLSLDLRPLRPPHLSRRVLLRSQHQPLRLKCRPCRTSPYLVPFIPSPPL